MGAQWDTLDGKLRSSLTEAVVSRSPLLTQQGLSNTLWALQEMGLVLYLHPAVDSSRNKIKVKTKVMESKRMRESLTSATLRLANVLSAQSYSTIVYSMAMMGCQYTALEQRSRTALESALARLGPAMGPKEISLALYGLGKMNMNLRSVPDSTRGTLLRAVADHCSGMDEQELGNTVWALSQVGHSVTVESVRALLCRVVEMQEELQWQSLLAILQGICSTHRSQVDAVEGADAEHLAKERTRTHWSGLPATLQDALLVTLTRLLAQSGTAVCNSRMAGTALYWLGRLQVSYFGLSVSLRAQLISQVCSPSPSPSSLSLSMKSTMRDNMNIEQNGRVSGGMGSSAGHPVVLAMNGIASMGATWNLLEAWDRELLECAVAGCLSPQLQQSDTRSTTTLPLQGDAGGAGEGRVHISGPAAAAAVLSPGDVSSLLWSLGRMGLQIGSLSSPPPPPPPRGSSSSPSPPTASLPFSDASPASDSIVVFGDVPGKTVGAATAVHAKGATQRRVNALELNLLNALEVTVSDMSAYEVAWCLWALARMGLTFSDLIASKRPLGSLLLLAINKHIVNMAERELGIVLWVSTRTWCNCNCNPNRIISDPQYRIYHDDRF